MQLIKYYINYKMYLLKYFLYIILAGSVFANNYSNIYAYYEDRHFKINLTSYNKSEVNRSIEKLFPVELKTNQ